MTNPLPVLLLAALAIGVVIAGKPVPAEDLVPARHAVLRRQLGHHAVVRHALGRAEDRTRHRGVANMPAAQLEKFYGSKEAAQIPIYMGYAFRGFNTHGRALFTLAHRAMAGRDEEAYSVTDGERICSMALGWNSATATCTTSS